MCMILLTGVISAFDFDNYYEYNENSKTVTIYNCNLWVGTCLIPGEKLARIQLMTDHENIVEDYGPYYQQVGLLKFHEFSDSYNELGMAYYDLKDGGQETQRDIKFKYRTTEEITIPIYEKGECTYEEDGDEDCEYIITGYETKEVERWIEFTELSEIPKKNVFIGIYADVQKGERVDWVPDKWFGVTIPEWAIWTESGNDLVHYYDFVEDDGTIVDRVGSLNPSSYNGQVGAISGIIGPGYQTNGTHVTDYVQFGAASGIIADKNFTIQVWVNTTGSSNNFALAEGRTDAETYVWRIAPSNGNFAQFSWNPNAGPFTAQATDGTSMNDGEWHHIIIQTIDAGNGDRNATIWLDGVRGGSINISQTWDDSTNVLFMGSGTFPPGNDAWQGTFDEVGFWNKSLTDTEINSLYSAGQGLPYGDAPVPQVTLNSPEDSATFSSSSITFNCTLNTYEQASVKNISLFHDGSGSWEINQTLTFFPLAEGLQNYWKLDETTGNVIDTVGSADGTNSEALRGIPGVINNAFNFSSVDGSAVNISDSDYWSFGNDNFTISLWARIYGNGYFAIITHHHSGATNERAWWMYRHNALGLIFSAVENGDGSGGNVNLQVLEPNLSNTTWNHIVITRDGINGTMYINGDAVASTLGFTFPINDANTPLHFGSTPRVGEERFLNGSLDEIGIWNRSLNISEVQELYNTGSGKAYEDTLLQKEDGIFDASFSDGTYKWNCQGCDDGGNCSFASSNRTFTIDSTVPIPTIIAPTTLIDYGFVGKNESLNWTLIEASPDTCWYEYNSTNSTVVCGSNSTTFLLDKPKTLTFYVNDTAGNQNSTTLSWEYKIFENERVYNSTSAGGTLEGFTINVTSNDSLIGGNFIYNSSIYDITQDGELWTTSLTIPLDTTNNEFYWNFTYDAEEIITFSNNQTITPMLFAMCNSTFNVTAYNITFKDEETSVFMNASLPLSTFDYWIDTPSFNKTLTLIEPVENLSYAFCVSPGDKTFNVRPYIQYKSTNYPQRIYEPGTIIVSNNTVNKTLYLLNNDDGLYVTFTVLDVSESPISDVVANVTREIDGEDVLVGTGVTDAAGAVTFWLNPDFSHSFSFDKTGYELFTTSLMPTQSAYTIVLSSGTTFNSSDYSHGVGFEIRPTATSPNGYLNNDTTYSFNITVTTSFWTISEFGIVLTNTTNDFIGRKVATTNGGTVNLNNNTGSNSRIYMDYYWIIDGDYNNGSIYWVVINSDGTQYGVKNFFDRLKLYVSGGIFGLDNFGLNLLIYLVIFCIVGFASYSFGINNPVAIGSLTFGLVYFFDMGVGLIKIDSQFAAVQHFPTIMTAIILIMLIIREVMR